MDKETALYLNAMNERFYHEVHESFSSTRALAWPGWRRAVEQVAATHHELLEPLRVLDLACGNMRFEVFLRGQLSDCMIEAHCVDNCAELAVTPLAHSFTQLDIVKCLIEEGRGLSRHLGEAGFDLAACFGFFHHVPTYQARCDLLWCLMRALKPGGFAVISFWRFMENDKLAKKAAVSHSMFSELLEAQGLDLSQLDQGDYLLGWQDREDVCRYCHHFTSKEVSQLLSQLENTAELVDRYFEDGRDGMTNEYLVLRRREISEISS